MWIGWLTLVFIITEGIQYFITNGGRTSHGCRGMVSLLALTTSSCSCTKPLFECCSSLSLLPLLSPPLPEDEDSGISSSDETTCLSPLELDFYCGCHYQLHHHHHHYCYPYLLYHILFDAAHTHYLARGTCMGIFHIEYFGYEHVLCWYAMATQQPPTLLLHPRSRFTLNEFKKVAGFLLFLFIS